MLQFLQQHCLVAHQVFFHLLGKADIGDVEDRQEHVEVIAVREIKLLRVEHQPPQRTPLLDEVDLVSIDGGVPCDRCAKQRSNLWQVPFAPANRWQLQADKAHRVDSELGGERCARCLNGEFAVE